jgi:hypothetical protein
MATSFRLKVGAGYCSLKSYDEQEKLIKKALKPDPKEIFKIVRRLRPDLKVCDECGEKLSSFAKYIKEGHTGAGGGGGCRQIKEAIQKAKVIYLLQEALKENVNINLEFISC